MDNQQLTNWTDVILPNTDYKTRLTAATAADMEIILPPSLLIL
jgi:hypothetical protein